LAAASPTTLPRESLSTSWCHRWPSSPTSAHRLPEPVPSSHTSGAKLAPLRCQVRTLLPELVPLRSPATSSHLQSTRSRSGPRPTLAIRAIPALHRSPSSLLDVGLLVQADTAGACPSPTLSFGSFSAILLPKPSHCSVIRPLSLNCSTRLALSPSISSWALRLPSRCSAISSLM